MNIEYVYQQRKIESTISNRYREILHDPMNNEERDFILIGHTHKELNSSGCIIHNFQSMVTGISSRSFLQNTK